MGEAAGFGADARLRADGEPSFEPWRFATSARARLRGLLRARPARGALVLVSCNDVHTFGMRYALDVAFVRADGRVSAVHRNVAPCRRLRCRDACAVVERFACGGPWLEAGDEIGMWLKGARSGCAGGKEGEPA